MVRHLQVNAPETSVGQATRTRAAAGRAERTGHSWRPTVIEVVPLTTLGRPHLARACAWTSGSGRLQFFVARQDLLVRRLQILAGRFELPTNEELDAAKEELQSTNEELNSVNEELHGRNEEMSRINSDLMNRTTAAHGGGRR